MAGSPWPVSAPAITGLLLPGAGIDVPLGVSIAAVLNGCFTWVIDEVSAAGLTVEPWRSLVLGIVVALAVFGGLVALMQRAHALAEQSAS